MANHTTIRLEAEKKEEFAKICESMGLSVSGAINLFVTKVLQCRKIPFEITADADPFYSEANQKFLLESIAQLERGEGIAFNDVSEVLATWVFARHPDAHSHDIRTRIRIASGRSFA